jgi:subtilisin family serine protease
MVLRGGCFPRARLMTAFSAVVTGLLIFPAHAEVRVVPGQYVISEVDGGAPRSARFMSGELEGHRLLRSLRPGVALVERGDARMASLRSEGSVPFDPSDTFCRDIIESGRARYCSPNYEIQALVSVPNGEADPRIGEQWGFERVGAGAVWSAASTAPESVVALVDSGIDYNHPDLRGILWENEAEVPANGIDDDLNGYVDDRLGVDFATGGTDPMDGYGHGTHIAGTIGALPENGIGIRGLVPNVKIMALRIFDNEGKGSLSRALEAFAYVEKMRQRGVPVRVINASWGGSGAVPIIEEAITRLGTHGIVVVAAAGNARTDNDVVPHFPASFNAPNLISVASISKGGTLSSFSNFGVQTVDIAAPGDGIVGTIPGAKYALFAGSSMAASFVTGAVALLAAREPGLSAGELATRIVEGGRPLSVLQGAVSSGRELSFTGALRVNDGGGVGLPGCIGNGCGAGRVSVKAVSVKERGVKGHRPIAAGAEIEVRVRASGSGTVPIRFSLDDYRCGSSVRVKVSSGSGGISLKTPQKIAYFNRISIGSGGKKASVAVRGSSNTRWSARPKNTQKSVCRSLIAAVK